MSEHGRLFKEWITFNQYRTIVEIGVSKGECTIYLCEAARITGGKVYGFDNWEVHGLKNQFKPMSTKEKVKDRLTRAGYSNFKLTKVDTKTADFANAIAKLKPIDFAFIDACHSYQGIHNDFMAVYPNLSETGSIAFHDTLRIDGCRDFLIDLLTKYKDGTFDVISLPWGNGSRRVGVSILTKRTYHKIGIGIDEICGSNRTAEQIYQDEKAVYQL